MIGRDDVQEGSWYNDNESKENTSSLHEGLPRNASDIPIAAIQTQNTTKLIFRPCPIGQDRDKIIRRWVNARLIKRILCLAIKQIRALTQCQRWQRIPLIGLESCPATNTRRFQIRTDVTSSQRNSPNRAILCLPYGGEMPRFTFLAFTEREEKKSKLHPHFLTKHLKTPKDFRSASSFCFLFDTFRNVACSCLPEMPHIHRRTQSAYLGTCLCGLCAGGAASLENRPKACGISHTLSTCESSNAAYHWCQDILPPLI